MRNLDKVTAFYGLKEQPFGVTPDTRFLYLSASHREALASMLFAIEARRGFSALIAQPGMGKTTLLFRLLQEIKEIARSAFIFQPDCSPPEFMRALLDDLGIRCENDGMSSLQRVLNDALVSEMRAGKRFVLVVDEAQDLDNATLERIRLLSNFETPTAKLLHIILVGQPQLAERLERPELTQLRQRVSAINRLNPFSSSESIQYVQHRLKVAGREDGRLFGSAALRTIADCSEGIPRNINNVCFLSLSLGFAKQEKIISAETVQEAVEDALPAPAAPEPKAPSFSPRHSDEDIAGPAINYSSFRYEKKPRGLGLVALVVLIIPIAAIFLLSNQQIESSATNWAAGTQPQIDSLTLDNIASLRPPAAPAIEMVSLDTTPDTANPEDPPATPAREVRRQDARSSHATRSPRAMKSQKPDNEARGPQRIRADRRQTLFELALIHYGKSNWRIIEQICAANPGLRCPYEVIQPGQRILLPDLSPEYPLLTAEGSSNISYGARE